MQGERPMSADNKSLGRFILDGIPPAPRGVPQIEVTFDIDADGILNVSAKDKATGREQSMRIMPSSGLRDEEIDKMVKDAEHFAEEDRKRKEEVELRNRADSTAYSAEKLLREQGEKVPDSAKSDIEAKISALRSALQDQSLDAIRTRLSDLEMALQQMGAAMYEQPGATPPPGGDAGPSPPPPDDEDVVEGEFTEA